MSESPLKQKEDSRRGVKCIVKMHVKTCQLVAETMSLMLTCQVVQALVEKGRCAHAVAQFDIVSKFLVSDTPLRNSKLCYEKKIGHKHKKHAKFQTANHVVSKFLASDTPDSKQQIGL